jgi:hypothetical protein
MRVILPPIKGFFHSRCWLLPLFRFFFFKKKNSDKDKKRRWVLIQVVENKKEERSAYNAACACDALGEYVCEGRKIE